MHKLVIGVVASWVALCSTWALAHEASLINDSMNMKPMTAAQTAELRAERDAAKAIGPPRRALRRVSVIAVGLQPSL
jgi:hypothetical protein